MIICSSNAVPGICWIYSLLMDEVVKTITRSHYWSDTILVSYTKQSSDEPRILEDDIVMMYGVLAGTYTYETVLGSKLTVPLMLVEYIDIQM